MGREYSAEDKLNILIDLTFIVGMCQPEENPPVVVRTQMY